MITKPAVLECTRCGKIFIGYDQDVRPKGFPRCLKCSARAAWDALNRVVAEKKSAPRGRKRRPAARTPTKRGVAGRRKPARKRR